MGRGTGSPVDADDEAGLPSKLAAKLAAMGLAAGTAFPRVGLGVGVSVGGGRTSETACWVFMISYDIGEFAKTFAVGLSVGGSVGRGVGTRSLSCCIPAHEATGSLVGCLVTGWRVGHRVG
jgi:hypothetical protein